MIVLDIETVPGVPLEVAKLMCGEEDPARYASLTPALAKIVCIGLKNDKAGKSLTPDVAASEYGMLLDCFALLEDRQRWPLVTFNGRRFDIPVLFASALRNGIPIPPNTRSLFKEYKYSKEPNHIDMWEVLTDHGACKGGLRAWCIGLGLGDPKASGDGADVAKMIADGQMAKVVEYCLSDCDFTLQLYKRWCLCTGRIP